MTIPHKYIYTTLIALLLTSLTYIIFFNSPSDKALQKQNEELLERVKSTERFMHDLAVERGLRVDTIREIQTKFKINENSYYKEIAFVLSADYHTTDSLYLLNSTRFDSAFRAGQFNP